MKRSTCLLLTLVLAACSRSARDPDAREQRLAYQEPKAAVATPKYVRAAADKLIAIGDVHGDLAVARAALKLAGAIDDNDHWSGGKLVVVQTGDTIDRGDEDREVIDLLERLRGEAKAAGGALIALSGNHELMNVVQDFRYVSQKSFEAFGGERGRGAAFSPGGPYARILADWPMLVQVGDSLFVHGGILEKHVEYGLDRINDEVRGFFRAERQPPAVVMAEDSPVWTRVYSDPLTPDCAQLERVLRRVGAKRMVVGHTPQEKGISAACEQKVWRIDTGMSHFYGGALQVLSIQGSDVQVLKAGN